MKKSPMKRRKSVIAVFVVVIVLLALLSVVPLLYRLITGPGVKTEALMIQVRQQPRFQWMALGKSSKERTQISPR